MKIAILADIHGNTTALQAIVDDCNSQNISFCILLGDLFSKGPCPDQVVDILQNFTILSSIKGNTDDWLIDLAINKRQRLFSKYMKSRNLEKIVFPQSMLSYDILHLDCYSFLLVHDLSSFLARENTFHFLMKNNIYGIFSGHTHIPSNKLENSIHFFNPGSVGMPYDGDIRASYGILSFDSKPHFEIRKIPYSISEEVEKAIHYQIPYRQEYTQIIQNGYKSIPLA